MTRWAGSLGLLASISFVSAQTWDGGATGGNANWNSANNWNPNGVPANTGTANITFAGTVKPGVNVNVNANVNSITFNPGVSFSLTGNNLTLQGGGIINSALDNSVNIASITLGASQSWQANGGNLTFASAALNPTLNIGTHTLTLSGTRNFTIANGLTGSGSLNVTSSGTTTLSGDGSAFSGSTTVSSGTLRVINGTGSATGTGTLTMGNGTVLSGNGRVGDLTLQSGSSVRVADNNATGGFAASDAIWNGGTLLKFEVNDAAGTAGTAVGWDKITADTMTLNANSGNRIVIDVTSLSLGGAPGQAANFDGQQSYSWLLVETTGGIFNFDESAFDIQLGNFANDMAMGDFALFNDGNNLFLNFTPIPEPSTVAFGALGGVLLAASALRRRKK